MNNLQLLQNKQMQELNAGKQTLTNYTAKYMAKGVDKLIEKAMEQATSGS